MKEKEREDITYIYKVSIPQAGFIDLKVPVGFFVGSPFVVSIPQAGFIDLKVDMEKYQNVELAVSIPQAGFIDLKVPGYTKGKRRLNSFNPASGFH